LFHRNRAHNRLRSRSEAGFTLVELTVVIVMIGIIIVPVYTFFNTSLNQYISLQVEGTSMTDLAAQTQRLANVLRSTTGIISVTANDIDCYAYFAPSDTYASQIHYYKTTGNKKLLADVTRMSANPPLGTPIPATKQTFTIIDNFYQLSGVNTFTYLDASGVTMALPITDLRTIKGIQVTLASPGGNLSKTSHQTMTLQVSLRNRKTNL
jgi:prepilin-type N-terminal cleavage/methylation domain-containing protein